MDAGRGEALTPDDLAVDDLSPDDLTVEVERSGGFAGLVRRARVEASALPPARAGELRALAARVDVAALAAQLAQTPVAVRGADRFVYAVRVERAGRSEEARLPESAVPADLAVLIRWVMGSGGLP